MRGVDDREVGVAEDEMCVEEYAAHPFSRKDRACEETKATGAKSFAVVDMLFKTMVAAAARTIVFIPLNTKNGHGIPPFFFCSYVEYAFVFLSSFVEYPFAFSCSYVKYPFVFNVHM